MTGCYITERRRSDSFHLTRAIGGVLARVSVGVVVVVKCVAATKQRLHSRCLECPLDCGRLVGSCSADDVRHRQRGFIGEYRWVGVNPKCER